MKLMRVGPKGQEKPALLDDNEQLRDLSKVIDDISAETLVSGQLEELSNLDTESLALIPDGQRVGPCISGVSKFVCVGLNYVDHAIEGNREIPKEPVIFLKSTSSIAGPNDPIEMPRESEKTDWEVELGIVIGKVAKNISEQASMSYVVGYCLVNDVSERCYQNERGGQWTKGKCLDTYGPIGPWLVTKDEIPDPHQLSLWTEVDSHRYQDGNTKNMIFSVPYIVSYVSQFMTLLPGDIIATGTPAGVGLGQKPNPVYLKVGQRVHLGIDGLGTQTHEVTYAS